MHRCVQHAGLANGSIVLTLRDKEPEPAFLPALLNAPVAEEPTGAHRAVAWGTTLDEAMAALSPVPAAPRSVDSPGEGWAAADRRSGPTRAERARRPTVRLAGN